MKMNGTENPPSEYWKPEPKCMIKRKKEENILKVVI